MQGGDGASGAVGLVSILGDYEGRTAGLFNHPGGNNADDAPVPSIAIEYQAEFLGQFRVLLQPIINFSHNAGFFILAFGVEQVELLSNLTAAILVLAGKELDYIARHVHASGSIDSRTEAKPYVSGGQGPRTFRKPETSMRALSPPFTG